MKNLSRFLSQKKASFWTDLKASFGSANKKLPLAVGVVLLVLLLLGGLLTLVAPRADISPQAETALFFSPDRVDADAGSIISLMIQVSSGQNLLAGVEVGLKFDPDLLELVGVIPGDFFPSAAIFNKKIDNQAGQAFFNLLCSPQEPGQGEGGLALVNFRVEARPRLKTTTVEFLPQTKAAAVGENKSVLRVTEKAIIGISN
jgi:hypothetical protein